MVTTLKTVVKHNKPIPFFMPVSIVGDIGC